MSGEQPELSIVSPLHNEAENVRLLFRAICEAIEPLGRSYEVLLVNDGSTDSTAEILDALAAGDPRLRPVHLDGNFGEAGALCAGFELARGRIVFSLDGDLQNDPADLPRLLRVLEEGGYRAVSGWRQKRQEAMVWRVLPSRIANWLIAQVTGVPSSDNGCCLKCYRAEVVKGKYLTHGLHRFLPAVFGVRAGEFTQIPVQDRKRHAGRSHYGLSRVFPVTRDLLTIPWLLSDPQRGLSHMSLLLGLAIFGLLTAGGLLFTGWFPAGSSVGLASAVLLGYAHTVRANLERWLRAQHEKTFRIRIPAAAPPPAAAVPGGAFPPGERAYPPAGEATA